MQPAKFFTDETKVTPENLDEAIQQAIEIEIATIPVYLYTYYSVNRVPDQNAISGGLVQELTAKGMPLAQANSVALDLSAQIMVYANKVGATIMSVVMEEMLHMALSSNLKQALVGQPLLTGRSPASYPTMLPGHQPEFEIDLAPFSLDQLMTFLKIESPKPLPPSAEALTAIPYTTIGEFYGMIKECVDTNDLPYDTDRPQLIPGQRYYSPNMIDTVYYDKQHKPRYVDADDSGDLVHVVDRASADKAITQIVEQGEGNVDAGFNPDGTVNCADPTAPDYDDPDREELSHFAKFAEIYCEYNTLSKQFAGYGLDADIGKYFIVNVPTNPSTAKYPEAVNLPSGTLQAISTLLNAVYTYIFVMTEACYRKEAGNNTQYEIFMFGIHKSMIFILDALCGEIKGLSFFLNGQYYSAAPTFENYPFGLLSSPKSQLVQLYNNAVALYPSISYLGQRINDLPDVPLN
ncbi:MAG TPA: ferritin-like domain-containing protein [Pyrinomonadaceae bacterium]|nr:ferritin-like domain-containing protein [Pyrinomonadaceae bacterium]